MSSDFNKASPGNEDTTPKQDWEIVPVSDVRLTAEEAVEGFMSFVEREYPEELHWLFAEINKMVRDGREKITLYFKTQNSRERVVNPDRVLPGVGHNKDLRWNRIAIYLANLGYTEKKPTNSSNFTTIDWSNPRRLHE